jgi:excinuclease UvrABC nuclease subunit
MRQAMNETHLQTIIRDYGVMISKEKGKPIKQLTEQRYNHAKNLKFEAAGKIRDQLTVLETPV